MTLPRPRTTPTIPVLLLAAILLSLLLLAPSAIYAANPKQSDPPHIFIGKVTVNGQPTPKGTEIAALIDGVPVAYAEVDGQGNYNIVVPVQNVGSIITFTIKEQEADQTGTFEVGGVTALDLSLSATPAPTDSTRIGLSCNAPIAPDREIDPTAGLAESVLMFAPLLGLAGTVGWRRRKP